MSVTPLYNRGRVFRDPVHGLIPISNKDGFLTELIDTQEFQRLHRVRQLGVASFTFPGTDHSRFCHSLGVLHVASRILDVLRNRYSDSVVSNQIDSHNQTIKAAALLHDIGHGPFSHLMERAFDVGKDHEERTKTMIPHTGGGIYGVLNGAGIDPKNVAEVIDHKFQFLFLQDIVSSQLDADRMDYLNPAIKRTDRDGYADSVLANSILLSNGKTNEQATPVAEVSKIFQALIDHRFRLRRLYCAPALKNEIDKIVKDTLASFQLDLPLPT